MLYFAENGGGRMIFEAINRRIKDIKKLHHLQDVKKNQDQQNVTDSKFRTLVEQTKLFSEAVHYTTEQLDFKVSESLAADIRSMLMQLNVISSEEYADKEAVLKAESSFKELQSSIKKEWSKHYSAYTATTWNTLRVISGINSEMVKDCMDNIKTAEIWTTDVSALTKMKNAMENAAILIQSLNMDQEIVSFLTKMTSGSATIVDLNEKVLGWIKSESLECKIKLSFLSR